MSVVFYNFRSNRLIVFLLLCCLSCTSTSNSVPEEDQTLNKELFDVFMSSKFGAKVLIPKDFELSTYNHDFYKWVYKKQKRVKLVFVDNPDFKGKVFDTQESQLHLVFCEVNSNQDICTVLDSVNRKVWDLSDADSLLVERTSCDISSYDGKWFLNTKTMGGACKASLFQSKNRKLLCYYLTKEYHDNEKQMTAMGDSILSTIEFFD